MKKRMIDKEKIEEKEEKKEKEEEKNEVLLSRRRKT